MGVSQVFRTKCDACVLGNHDDCIDNVSVHAGADVWGFYPLCSCKEGECEPTKLYACTDWLHNCPGCPCSCHDDPELRAAWSKVHTAWVEQRMAGAQDYGPKPADQQTVGEEEA